jgi:hypothetical protein
LLRLLSTKTALGPQVKQLLYLLIPIVAPGSENIVVYLQEGKVRAVVICAILVVSSPCEEASVPENIYRTRARRTRRDGTGNFNRNRDGYLEI